jgi:hypothetical protein
MEDLEVQEYKTLTIGDLNQVLEQISSYKPKLTFNWCTTSQYDFMWDLFMHYWIYVRGVQLVKKKGKLYTYQGIIFDDVHKYKFTDKGSVLKNGDLISVFNYNQLSDTLVQFDLKEKLTNNEFYLKYSVI